MFATLVLLNICVTDQTADILWGPFFQQEAALLKATDIVLFFFS